MKKADSVKIGIEFQSPVGESATHLVDYFELEKKTVDDLRKGEWKLGSTQTIIRYPIMVQTIPIKVFLALKQNEELAENER